MLKEMAPTEQEERALEYLWEFWARPKQLAPPGDWRHFLILAGRGFGKTRAITEWARRKAETMPGSRGAIVSPTAADARDIVVEGESGILAVCPPWSKPLYEPSKRRITWPNGTMATLYTADEPDRLRGPQHHWAISDELAAWRYVEDAWANLMFGLRLGDAPQNAIATTPRPIPIIRRLLKDPAVVVVRGSTYENRSNLAQAFFDGIISHYEGTRLGRQELNAEILDDMPGALWTRDTLEESRVRTHRLLTRIVVAVDPAATARASSDETGIVIAGVGQDGHGYVLSDVTMKGSPAAWGELVVKAFDRYEADRVVAETNNGGDMVEHVIRTAARDLHSQGKRTTSVVAFKQVRASRGKHTRAEPVAALYEQKRVHHVGMFALLEDQLCSWVPGDDSPDRLDALVWAITELMLGDAQPAIASQVVSREQVQSLFG